MNNDLFDLRGKVALVTGGSKGLGKAMGRALAEAGADVFICSRKEDELKAAAAEIKQDNPGRVAYAVADMTKRGDVQRLVDKTVAELGKIDILVNNAGSNTPQAIDKVTDEAWNEILELNLSSCMALSRAVAPQMKERRWGRIIHISSILGLASKDQRSVYSATKFGLIGLAKASAIDLGEYNITVNCICPGAFVTDLPMRVLDDKSKELVAQRTVLKRWGDPRELAGPVLLLASEAGSYITGATLVVDGGTLSMTF